MTDDEIIKALECCITLTENKCPECPNNELRFKGIHCKQQTYKNALDLINRQKAEIERLNGNLFTISNACMQRRNEAIKEFAERLISKVVNTPFGVNCSGETDEYKEGCLRGLVAKQHNVLDMINNLVKEMVGAE